MSRSKKVQKGQNQLFPILFSKGVYPLSKILLGGCLLAPPGLMYDNNYQMKHAKYV